MSGPKYSTAELERQRLLMIKKQLEEELENAKCAELMTNIKTSLSKLKSFTEDVDTQKYLKWVDDAEKLLPNNKSIKEIRKQIKCLNELVLIQYSVSGTSTKLAKTLQQINTNIQKINNTKKYIEELLKSLNQEYNSVLQENREQEFESTEWEKKEPISSVSQDVIECYKNIIEALIDFDDFESEKVVFDTILNNHKFDDQFKIKQLKMRFQAILVEKQSDEELEQHISLRSEYIALCNLLYGECRSIPQDTESLNMEIIQLKKALEEKTTGQYIANSLKMVMEGLGYDILTQDILVQQKMTKQFFDYSDASAVTVASSDTGAVMLEVVGKQNETNGITKSDVKKDMEKFCPDYEKVKAGLHKYGVSLSDTKLCPPDEKYVRFVDIKTEQGTRRVEAKSKRMRMSDE